MSSLSHSSAVPVASSNAFVLKRHSSWMNALGLLGVFLIIIPQINIVSVPGQNAGLRIDDFLIATSWLLIIWHIVNSGGRLIGSQGYLTFIGISALSVVVARIDGWHGNILYPIRLVEYSTFLYFGYFFSRSFKIRGMLIIILLVEGVVMIAQALHLLGGFSVTGYVSSTGRVIGLTSGPWEIGYILNLVYVALLQDAHERRANTGLLTIVVAALLILTQSRSAEFSFLVVFLLYTASTRDVVTVVKSALVLGIVFLAATTFLLRDILARNGHLLTIRNLSYVLALYRDIHPPSHFSAWQFRHVPHVQGVDPSWLIRSTHWVIAFKDWAARPLLYLTGLGFGVFGPALDGGWLRLLVETGLIGLLTYVRFLVNIWKNLPFGFYLSLVTAINMLFIDMQLSYKGMALLLFLIGYYGGRSRWHRLHSTRADSTPSSSTDGNGSEALCREPN